MSTTAEEQLENIRANRRKYAKQQRIKNKRAGYMQSLFWVTPAERQMLRDTLAQHRNGVSNARN